MQSLFEFDTAPEVAEIGRVNCRAAHLHRLHAILGNGADWEYRGIVSERQRADGQCACGHAIRFEFTIHHKVTERTVIVGSDCVCTYPGVSDAAVAAVAADVERLEKAARERVAAAKRAAEDSRIQQLAADLSAAYWELDRILAAIPSNGYGRPSRRIAYDAFRLWYGADKRMADYTPGMPHPWARLKPYKSRAAMRKNLESRLEKVRALVARPYES